MIISRSLRKNLQVAILSSVAVCGYILPAKAQEASDETIIVTGTRQYSRTKAESLAPVDVLSERDLEKSGLQSTRDLLGALVPSISVSSLDGGGASYAVKTVSLRGLASDQTLVLVNGKRRHNTATLFINGQVQNGQSPADIDLIPASAISRVEVLRDGASAQYGSDAIAGVVNIILKSDPRGGSMATTFGATGSGDGQSGRIQLDHGLSLGENGHLHLSADGLLQNPTNRSGPNRNTLYFPVNGQPDPREATVDRVVSSIGQPRVESVNLTYDAGIDLDDLTLYSFGTYSHRDATGQLSFRQPNQLTNVIEIYPDGFAPRLLVADRDFQFVAGARGKKLAGFDWDLSASFARDKVDYTALNTLNASLGPSSPTQLYIGSAEFREFMVNADVSRYVNSGLFAEPLFIAFGAEYRKNWYEIGEGEPDSYRNGGYVSTSGPLANRVRSPGAQGVNGFTPESAGKWSRDSIGVYGNIEQTLVPGWSVSLAGRYEHYTDAGNSTTGRLSSRLEPIKGFALRGTLSTGFRAPTLQQQHYASGSTIGLVLPGTTVSQLYPVTALPPDSPAARALGARHLTPEKSKNYSLGVVLQPVAGLDISVDAYQIDVDDKIILSGTLVGPAVSTALANAGLDPMQGGFYFSNAGDTRTRGVDIVANYRLDLGDLGSATLGLAANFNKTKFLRVASAPPELVAAGLTLIDRVRQADLSRGTPRDKIIASVNWRKSAFEIDARATRYGKVTMASALPSLDQTGEPKTIVDLTLSYQLNEGVRLTVGANNLFNTFPTAINPAYVGNTGVFKYNSFSPFGSNGGFYYGRLGFRF